MSGERLYLNTVTDRLWHAVHVLGITLLVLSGFNIHFAGSFDVLGSVERAVRWHNAVGVVVSIDWGIWFLYNLFSARIRFYLPGRDDLPAGIAKQAGYYLFGIFRGEDAPYPASPTRKFNPIQKWIYLAVMGGLVPFQIGTGAYMLWAVTSAERLGEETMFLLSVTHTAVSFLSAAFIIAHVYLATTGKNLASHFRLMITGWHEAE